MERVRYDFQKEIDEEEASAFTEDLACAKHSARPLTYHIIRADSGFAGLKHIMWVCFVIKTKLGIGP